jgi:PhnB protein
MSVKPIPTGYHAVTPYLVVDNATRAIDFYKRAFGAKEVMRMDGPQGKIAHAEIKIGDSIVMLSDEILGTGARSPRSLGGTASSLMLYVEDVDATFAKATGAGAEVEAPLANMFWGDRYCKVKDPFGHSWAVATHKEDVAPDEMVRRVKQETLKRQQSTSATS